MDNHKTIYTRSIEQIFEVDKLELIQKAAACGIDWHKVSNRLINYTGGNIQFDKNIELDSEYRGKVAVWITIKETEKGEKYPGVSFNTVKHGGVTKQYSGLHSLFTDSIQKELPKTINTHVPDAAELDRKIIRFNKFDSKFRGLDHANHSDTNYLFKKGLHTSNLPDSFVLKKGIDSRGEFIVFQLINLTGTVAGYQKLYNDFFTENEVTRNKDYIFYPGRKNGSFAVLGDITSSKIIYLCEGLATALSVFLSTGTPTIICLDLPNIPNIVNLFKANHSIVIAADNDGKHVPDSVTSLLGESIRLVQSYIPGAGKCDYNDVYMELGVNEVCKQLQIYHNIIEFNTRHLNEIEFNDGVTGIKSTYGTGKTYKVAEYVKSNLSSSVIYIAHLITLCDQAASKLKIKSYNDTKFVNSESRISICINSLPRILKSGGVNPIFDIVILDEVEQLLSRLASSKDSQMPNKEFIFSMLKYLIQHAKKVICLDADLSDITIKFLEECRPNERFDLIINKYVHKKTLYVYENEESLITQAKKVVESEEPLLFLTNTLAGSTLLYNMFDIENKRVINSDTTNLPEIKNFIVNIDAHCQQDQLTICSPSLSTGVSIESGHYKHNFAIFSNMVNNPLDCLQQLERDRVTTDKHVYINPYKNTIRMKNIEEAVDYTLLKIGKTGHIIKKDIAYSMMCKRIIDRDVKLMSNFKEAFIEQARAKGYTVEFVSNNLTDDEKETLKLEKQMIKEELNEHRIHGILDAEPITKVEYENYKNQLGLLPEEKFAVIRYELESFYHKPISEELILEDNHGKNRQQIRNLRVANFDDQYIKEKQFWNFKDKFIEDVDYILIKHELYNNLLDAIGVNPTTITKTKDYYQEHDIIDFYKWANSNRKVLSVVWNVPQETAFMENPYKYIGLLINTLGLKQSPKNKKVNKKCVRAGYFITDDSLDYLRPFMRHNEKESFTLNELLEEIKPSIPIIKPTNKFAILDTI